MNLWMRQHWLATAISVVAFGALAASAVWCVVSFERSRGAERDVRDARQRLAHLHRANPFPNATNQAHAEEQWAKVRGMVAEARRHFEPVAFTNVTGKAFKDLLAVALFDLRRQAEDARVTLPSKDYAFTFGTQRATPVYPRRCFPALPRALAEVQSLCRLVFAARCDLLGLRREPLTLCDPLDSAQFTELRSQTNPATGAVRAPYELTLGCTPGQLAELLNRLSESPHGFVVSVLALEALPFPAEARPPHKHPPQAPTAATVFGAAPAGEPRMKVSLLVYVVRLKEAAPAALSQHGKAAGVR